MYREATSLDVAAMERCRIGDADAGPADERMARYFDGEHHPQQALLPRTGFVAIVDDEVVGYIAGHLTRRYDCDGEVQYLYVAPNHRRKGIASALLRLMAEWFKTASATKVCVNANIDSPPAVPFYVDRGAVALNTYWYVWEDIAVLLRD